MSIMESFSCSACVGYRSRLDPDSIGPVTQIRTTWYRQDRKVPNKKKNSKKPMWRAEGFACSITVLFMSVRKNLWRSVKFFFNFH
jgi:hypothetical protein